MRIVSIGECMAELAPLEAPETYRLGFAGDTLNTAWYLRRLRPAWRVDYCTAIGRDAMSGAMHDFFGAAGLGTDHVQRDPDRTVGLYLIALRDGERSFSYWRGQSAARHLADDPARLRRALGGADIVYLSGITLGILDGEARGRLLDAVRGSGGRVVFDPNLRPRLWSDPGAMCAAVARAAAISDIVLPSFDDECRFFGDADPAGTIARYRALGVDTVVVKNGAGPILFAAGDEAGEVAPPPVDRVVDSTAAGDSFNAGFLAARLDGAPMRAAVDGGARLARHVIGARGALVPLPPADG